MYIYFIRKVQDLYCFYTISNWQTARANFDKVFQDIDNSNIQDKDLAKSLVNDFKDSINNSPENTQSFFTKVKNTFKENPELITKIADAGAAVYKAWLMGI